MIHSCYVQQMDVNYVEEELITVTLKVKLYNI